MSHYTPLFDSICTSERMADLPDDTCRLFYVWMLAKCDAWGRLDARPRKLNASVWPLLGKSDAETARVLEVLRAAGLVEVYWPQGLDPFIQVPDWEGKAGTVGRKRDRRRSAHPDPDGLADCKTHTTGSHRISPDTTGSHRTPPIPGGAVDGLVGVGVGVGVGARREPPQTWETVLALPEFDALRSDPGWMAAWSDWIEHARTPGTKARVPKPKGARAAFRYALEVGPAAHAEAIQASIRNDWQGINVEWVRRGSGPSGRVQSHADRAIEDFKAMGGKFEGEMFGDVQPQLGGKL